VSSIGNGVWKRGTQIMESVMPHIGRELCMKTFFGKLEPTEFDVLTGTFGQILSSGAENIRFEIVDMDHIFYANVDWIVDATILTRQLSGGLIPYPKLGDNVCRIETSYRYLYNKVLYGDIKYIKTIKNGDYLFNEQWRANEKQYILILREFGKYKWDEKPEVLQL
jgi:hypothetical protein